MIYILSKLGFTIDLCYCNDLSVIDKLRGRKYDWVIGFGEVFKQILKIQNIEKSILFITENNPIIVEKKYNERLEYFKKRRNLVKIQNYRNTFYDIEQYKIANWAICMNSTYNSKSMVSYFKKLYHINVNGFFNKHFILKENTDTERCNSFVWFGSTGVIHKGLDILVEAFAKLPSKRLNIYGISKQEIAMIKPYIGRNTFLHEKINVMDNTFISEVVEKNAFIVSLSCSEGMQSGVATCMLHGLIPIVTKETGYESQNFIFEFSDYHLDSVVNTILHTSSLSIAEINRLSRLVYDYAHKNFSLISFSNRFECIIKDLMKNNNE
ncbi:hypothetical protein K0E75_12650 [Bacteroides fragilis]|uniref:hypothetical protein n=1 Tax=Bacteroides TaxID=816 RepID=UPI00202E1ADF|nr:hypothetical protein [Bacteroides fragilis]MCE8588374.1 hypothetical protein [Bacteroides fragilis]MCE8592634.1 hypothetical protein [Bacteroides fragilis]MCE8659457.1 hypothetical protein [Bacteroides fragilis]MCE8663149.1 hypothetical protein [Bacteroides fragilis]MCM0264310.1 hypothetical protein [Bacteroides fragilis]